METKKQWIAPEVTEIEINNTPNVLRTDLDGKS